MAWRAKVAQRRRLLHYIYADRVYVPCCYCMHPLLLNSATIEHILPRSLGGRSVTENVAVACAQCNKRRGIRPFWPYWRAFRLLTMQRRAGRRANAAIDKARGQP